jgi:murein DD-endopeptidase MepM/ murein hydrolase activator NlpD
MKIKSSLILILILALPAWAEPLLSLQGNPSQGGLLLLRLKGAAANYHTAKARFQNHCYQLLPAGQNFEAILPLSADAPTGTYTLKIELEDQQNQKQTLKRLVKITKTTFPRQYLTLSSDNLSKYEDPAVEKEYQLIETALAQFIPQRLWKGNFILPCPGGWTTLYGAKRFINGEEAYWHRGVDIAASWGTPVKAANDGVVSLTGENFILHGKTIILDHGLGVSTLYIHLSKILVKPGQKVRKGEIIGKVGNTGAGTGAHLHWGTYILGTPIAPSNLLKLPLDWL